MMLARRNANEESMQGIILLNLYSDDGLALEVPQLNFVSVRTIKEGSSSVGRAGGLLFILGLNLGGVGPVRGLRGGGRRGWCEE
jgi:hypothetical protein